MPIRQMTVLAHASMVNGIIFKCKDLAHNVGDMLQIPVQNASIKCQTKLNHQIEGLESTHMFSRDDVFCAKRHATKELRGAETQTM